MLVTWLLNASAEVCSADASALAAAAAATASVWSSWSWLTVGAEPLSVAVPAITLGEAPLPMMIPCRDWTVTLPVPALSWPMVMKLSAVTRMFWLFVLRLPITATPPLPGVVPALMVIVPAPVVSIVFAGSRNTIGPVFVSSKRDWLLGMVNVLLGLIGLLSSSAMVMDAALNVSVPLPDVRSAAGSIRSGPALSMKTPLVPPF